MSNKAKEKQPKQQQNKKQQQPKQQQQQDKGKKPVTPKHNVVFQRKEDELDQKYGSGSLKTKSSPTASNQSQRKKKNKPTRQKTIPLSSPVPENKPSQNNVTPEVTSRTEVWDQLFTLEGASALNSKQTQSYGRGRGSKSTRNAPKQATVKTPQAPSQLSEPSIDETNFPPLQQVKPNLPATSSKGKKKVQQPKMSVEENQDFVSTDMQDTQSRTTSQLPDAPNVVAEKSEPSEKLSEISQAAASNSPPEEAIERSVDPDLIPQDDDDDSPAVHQEESIVSHKDEASEHNPTVHATPNDLTQEPTSTKTSEANSINTPEVAPESSKTPEAPSTMSEGHDAKSESTQQFELVSPNIPSKTVDSTNVPSTSQTSKDQTLETEDKSLIKINDHLVLYYSVLSGAKFSSKVTEETD